MALGEPLVEQRHLVGGHVVQRGQEAGGLRNVDAHAGQTGVHVRRIEKRRGRPGVDLARLAYDFSSDGEISGYSTTEMSISKLSAFWVVAGVVFFALSIRGLGCRATPEPAEPLVSD